ncbi:hypothetical protein Q3G72_031813 [Acer saccharum]|nr:hypothetical protein Q3G72_031813 [Acer saccharum]
MFSVKPVFITILSLSLFLALILLSPSSPFSSLSFTSSALPKGKSEIWSVRRLVEWRPCKWWLQGHLTHNCIGFLLKSCSFASKE